MASKDSSLRPKDNVQKLLLSTPAQFIGEYETEDLLISPAFPPMYTGNQKWFRGSSDSLNRSAIILAFRTTLPEPAPGVIVPNYEPAGEYIASAMSVLYGKRFDSHGPFEMTGTFYLPDLTAFSTPCEPHHRHNSKTPRLDHSVPLDLHEFGRISGLVLQSNDNPGVAAFHAAAKLYRRALQSVEVDPEGAYLNLITAGEIVSNNHSVSEADALDPATHKILDRVAKEMPDGVKIASSLRAKLRSIKRRFVCTMRDMTDEAFFDFRESERETWTFKRKDFVKRVGAAYDLRSKFVHSGYPFGRWISREMDVFEVPVGRPLIQDKEMAKVLERAPMFSGLERLIRHVLLKFAGELGSKV
jgi:hypothetical protein